MARGAEGKQRRKNERKEAKAKEAALLEELNKEIDENNDNGNSNRNDDGNDSSDSDDEIPFPEPTSGGLLDKDLVGKRIKKGQKKRAAEREAASCCGPPPTSGKGIKTAPLVLLAIMTGTTLLPALIYAGDWLGSFAQNHHVLGSIGYKLGVGPSPRKRVYSFYEKHDPEKISDVPDILSRYYGDYPKLTKRLERKYNDYGYFLGWQEDEAPMKLAMEKLEVTRDHLGKLWQRHAPPILKTGARNMRYNIGFLLKKGKKVWKKQVWPVLEPFLGVPEGGEAQKKRDAREAASRRKGRKNTQFRDDDEM